MASKADFEAERLRGWCGFEKSLLVQSVKGAPYVGRNG
jgi:hypothetical protein